MVHYKLTQVTWYNSRLFTCICAGWNNWAFHIPLNSVTYRILGFTFLHMQLAKISLAFANWKQSLQRSSSPPAICFSFTSLGFYLQSLSVGFAILSISAWWKACFLEACGREITKAPRLRFQALQHPPLRWLLAFPAPKHKSGCRSTCCTHPQLPMCTEMGFLLLGNNK